ncbi:MAG: nucleoside phosphorylase, partial [Actinomycetia bacterium]|nr:nucleoside phosphorylase [Actinomycetes bacterium]
MELPLLDDDLDGDGVIEPAQVVRDVDVPECAVLCFFGDVVHDVVGARADARLITKLASEAGTSPVWEIDVGGQPVAVVQPGVGAPLAVAYTEELIAMGARKIVACGGAGALVPELAVGSAVVVDSAVRDEGTSYHYAPAAGVIDADPDAVATIVKACEADGVAHVIGRSWTTDAIYRETRGRVARRV